MPGLSNTFGIAMRNFTAFPQLPDAQELVEYGVRMEELGFDEASRRMKVLALHPGVTIEEVQDNTGFRLLVADALETTEPPSERELAVLRHLDPDKLYIA